MNSLEVPEEVIGSMSQSPPNVQVVSIVVENIDSGTEAGSLDGKSNGLAEDRNDKRIDALTREDLGLNVDESEDVYDGLIRDFRTKMDSLSFKRLNKNDIKAQAADFLAKRENSIKTSDAATTRYAKKNNKSLMLPAGKFQEMEDGERRDTGSSDRSRFSSGASHLSDKYRRKFRNKSQFTRRKSVMGNFMKRGRTVRKTLRAMHINEGDGRSSESGYGLPPTNEQKLRMFVLKEIFDTETEYMKLLQFMCEVMSPCLEKMGSDPDRAHSCGKDTVTELLSNVKEIYRLHIDFQSALQDVFVPAPFHSHCIGNIFLHFKDKFRVYNQYCGNFSKAQKICYKLEKDPDLKEVIKEWKTSVESKSRRFLHLEGFVISPVQRLCKYPLFLKELKKYTPPNHKDHSDVAEAQVVMGGVTAAVNESEKRQLTVQAIRDMESMCDSWEQSGFVTRQGFLTKRGGSVKSWYIRWFILQEYKLAYYNEPTDLRPLGVLDLTSYKSVEPDASEIAGRPFAFSIKMPDRTYFMYATSEEERQEWLNTLQWKFDCIERTRRQSHHPFETVVFSSISSFIHPKSRRSEIDMDNNANERTDLSEETINRDIGEQDEVFEDGKRNLSSNGTPETKPKSVSLSVTFSDTITVNEPSPTKKNRAKSYSKANSSPHKSGKTKKSSIFAGKRDK